MKWEKRGLIFKPEKISDWQDNTFTTPIPLLIKENLIRIFGGFRDKQGVSRIGYIDVLASNPSEIIEVSKTPVLDIGKKGMFDDNGVILGSVFKDENKIRMYYVGFQLVNNVKFLAFSGLAISTDNGTTFKRHQETPIFDRYKNEHYFRAIHAVLKINNTYKVWYAAGDSWEIINNISYPRYKIFYAESHNGIDFEQKEGISVIDCNKNEYRIGRPTVFFEEGIYKMYFTSDTFSKEYRAGYAESKDGIHWERMDEKLGLNISSEGWDSEMICYPTSIKTPHGNFLFYSGNGMGHSGVGYAELINESNL